MAGCIAGQARADFGGASVWRDALACAGGPAATGRNLHDSGFAVPALVRGGFFPAFDAADPSCVSRMAEARQLREQLNHLMLGIAVDVCHVWGDPDPAREIALAGQQQTLSGFDVCGWKVNGTHPLNDRGLMGDGCIDLRTSRGWVETACFTGRNEVELFSEHYWAMNPATYAARIRDAWLEHV